MNTKTRSIIAAVVAVNLAGCDPWPCSPPTEGCTLYEEGGDTDGGNDIHFIGANQICVLIGTATGQNLGAELAENFNWEDNPKQISWSGLGLSAGWRFNLTPGPEEHVAMVAVDDLVVIRDPRWYTHHADGWAWLVVEGAQGVSFTPEGKLPETYAYSIELAPNIKVYYAPEPDSDSGIAVNLWRVHGVGARVHGSTRFPSMLAGPAASNMKWTATSDKDGELLQWGLPERHCRSSVWSDETG